MENLHNLDVLQFESQVEDKYKPPIKANKGGLYGDCNRTACPSKRAIFYNPAKRAYYCKSCALTIQRNANRDGLVIFPKLVLFWELNKMKDLITNPRYRTPEGVPYQTATLPMGLYDLVAMGDQNDNPQLTVMRSGTDSNEHIDALMQLEFDSVESIDKAIHELLVLRVMKEEQLPQLTQQMVENIENVREATHQNIDELASQLTDQILEGIDATF